MVKRNKRKDSSYNLKESVKRTGRTVKQGGYPENSKRKATSGTGETYKKDVNRITRGGGSKKHKPLTKPLARKKPAAKKRTPRKKK
jgi:hypothetical protein